MVTTNKHILNWVDEMAALCTPDKIVWIDGSEEQADALRAEACSTGEMIKLNPEKLPGCYLHRTAVNDVALPRRKTPATSTTGWTPRNATKSSQSSIAAP